MMNDDDGILVSLYHIIQNDKSLVDKNNELIVKCKGDIKKLTSKERNDLTNIRAAIRAGRSLLSTYMDPDSKFGVPLIGGK